MAQIDIKQISNFPDLPTTEQVDVLYLLLNRLLIQLTIQGIKLEDELLQEQLEIALSNS